MNSSSVHGIGYVGSTVASAMKMLPYIEEAGIPAKLFMDAMLSDLEGMGATGGRNLAGQQADNAIGAALTNLAVENSGPAVKR